MLQFIRSKASSWFFKILFMVLVASFAIWGIGDVIRSKVMEITVANVGGNSITGQEYQREYQKQLKRMSGALGDQFNGDIAKQMGLPQQVLDQMVAQSLFSRLAENLGLRAPDDVITGTLAAAPAFRNQQGQYDPQLLAQFIQQQGMSQQAFILTLRDDMIRNQIYDAIAIGAVAPKPMINAIYGYQAEKRVADTLLIADASIKTLATPDQAVLEKFLKDNADRYQAPEYRKLTLLRLQPAAVAAAIKVSDQDIAKEFDTHPDLYAVPEKRQLLTFTVPDETKAKAAVDAIAGGGDFAAEAKKASGIDPVDTGLVARQGLLPELADAAFSAGIGSVVGPVKTVLGWQVAKILKVEVGRAGDLASVRDKIAKKLADAAAADSLVSMANQVDDALAGGASLEDAAKKLGLALQSVPAVTRDGLDAAGKPLADLTSAPQLLPTAFATDTGQNSAQIEDGAGGYFVLRVDQVTPPTLRSFDQVKDKLLADWTADAESKASADQAAKIVDRLKAGEDIKTIAQSLGIAVKRSSPFTRDRGDEANDVPASLAALLFSIKLGEAATAPNDSTTNPGHVVAKLVDIQSADPAGNADAVKQVGLELSKTLGNDLLGEFRRALQNEIPVKTDPATAQSLI
jgi:peptidyl-prolyl cis-trans isomerase D